MKFFYDINYYIKFYGGFSIDKKHNYAICLQF